MNRAERRRAEKAGLKVAKEPTLNLKVSDYNRYMDNAVVSAKDRATKAALHEINQQILEQDEKFSLDVDAMVLWTLHVFCGFGKKRLEKFYEDMLKEHIRMREYYEIDDTYPERYKLKELCDVNVEALNNKFFGGNLQSKGEQLMARTFYSEYINHCLRFYARHPIPKFHSESDKENWNACDKALKSFPDKERQILLAIYTEGDTIPDNVYQISKKNGIAQDTVWKWISELERKVAKRRGLL